MTTISTSGDVSSLLLINATSITSFNDDALSFFYQSFQNTRNDVELDTITFDPIHSTNADYYGLTSDGGTLHVSGTNLNSGKGTLSVLDYHSSGNTSYWYGTGHGTHNGPITGDLTVVKAILTNLMIYNDANSSDHIELIGNFKVNNNQLMKGTFTQQNIFKAGLEINLYGNIVADLNNANGFYKSIHIQDSSGSIDLSGKFSPHDLDVALGSGITFNDFVNAQSLLSGNDTFNIANGSNSWHGYSGNDKMNGGAGNDSIYGDSGNDALNGNVGEDILNGGDGNDKINGGDGNDIINGAKGVDVLTGGIGNDTFIFDNFSNGNKDKVTDFISGQDLLKFDASIFTSLVGFSTDNLVSTPKGDALDNNDFLLFNTKNHTLYYDADGNGVGHAVAVITLTGVNDLHANDIIIA